MLWFKVSGFFAFLFVLIQSNAANEGETGEPRFLDAATLSEAGKVVSILAGDAMDAVKNAATNSFKSAYYEDYDGNDAYFSARQGENQRSTPVNKAIYNFDARVNFG